MRHGDLKIWTEEWEGTPVVAAEGEVDLATVDSFRQAASDAVRQKPETVIFDLRKVTFIDSSGLGILVATRKKLNNDPSSVVVVTDQPAVLQSLQITGLDRVLRVEREPAAIRSSLTS
jgi:anti-sigma B factor antagonist